MPTLSDFRRWLRGAKVSGFPSWPRLAREKCSEETSDEAVEDTRKKRLDVSKAEALGRMDKRYSFSVDGRDAVLRFGKYTGRSLREIYSIPGGDSYLRWICSQDFPDDLKSLASEILKGS